MLSLTRWNPFEDLNGLHREMDRVFGRSYGDNPKTDGWSWVPATEVTSDKEGWKVKMALPGIEPKNVHVDLHGNLLTVKGERTIKEENAEKHISEIGYGSFERSFTLPDEVDAEKVHATFDNGMLMLTLPVAEQTKPRKIEIGSGKAA